MINEIKTHIWNITYNIEEQENEIESDNEFLAKYPKPQLLNWTILEFEWFYMKIKLDFSNKLYISPNVQRNDFLNLTVNDT